MKKWYQSKTLWFNLVMTVILTAQLVEGFYKDLAPLTGIVAGFGNVLLRVWFTETKLTK